MGNGKRENGGKIIDNCIVYLLFGSLWSLIRRREHFPVLVVVVNICNVLRYSPCQKQKKISFLDPWGEPVRRRSHVKKRHACIHTCSW